MFRNIAVSLLSTALVFCAFAKDSGNAIRGGQIYDSLHRSSPEEFAQRKAYYRELVNLANANRQRDSITLNMKEYRAIADSVWEEAGRLWHNQIRAIPICGELIPAEYQEPESRKNDYYKQESAKHNNFCDYLKGLTEKNRNICLYCSLSTEIEALEKPLLDLSPETIYTIKNLEGRMEYLRKLYPERSRIGKLIAEGNPDYISPVNRDARRSLKWQIQERWKIKEENDLLLFEDYPPEKMKKYNGIAIKHFNKMRFIYGDNIDFYPLTEEYMLPLDCLELDVYSARTDRKPEEARKKYMEEHKNRHLNFQNYLESIPEWDRLICLYFQKKHIFYFAGRPILDLSSDESYPMDNLYLRRDKMCLIANEIRALKSAIDKIENNQKGKTNYE